MIDGAESASFCQPQFVLIVSFQAMLCFLKVSKSPKIIFSCLQILQSKKNNKNLQVSALASISKWANQKRIIAIM